MLHSRRHFVLCVNFINFYFTLHCSIPRILACCTIRVMNTNDTDQEQGEQMRRCGTSLGLSAVYPAATHTGPLVQCAVKTTTVRTPESAHRDVLVPPPCRGCSKLPAHLRPDLAVGMRAHNIQKRVFLVLREVFWVPDQQRTLHQPQKKRDKRGVSAMTVHRVVSEW